MEGRVSQSVSSESTTANPATMIATTAGQFDVLAVATTVVDDAAGSEVVVLATAPPSPLVSPRVSSSTGAGNSGSGLALVGTSIQATTLASLYCWSVRKT